MRKRAIAGLALAIASAGWFISFPAAPPAAALPAGFSESTAISGLTEPSTVRFAPDGRVFVAEISGLIKVFDSLTDTTPTTFADLRTSVFQFWERGLIGLELDPNFPADPYVYVFYVHDAQTGGVADDCPDPTEDGCVVSSRVSRLQAAGNVMTGAEDVLVEDWCQQFPVHTGGGMDFGADGMLYVTGGEGASSSFADYGQRGDPPNPCDDGDGGVQSPPTAEGGRLRSQDLRTSGDPVTLGGSLIRVDPDTGSGPLTNPLGSDADPNARRIIAYGFRNPFRLAVRPGTNEVWVGNVGANAWEEIDRVADPAAPVENSGWPCYEGGRDASGMPTSLRFAQMDSLDLDICEDLYAESGAVMAPYFAYQQDTPVFTGDTCPTGGSALAGLAFSPQSGSSYPASYSGALFFADHSRDCIWVMHAGAGGLPDPSTRQAFQPTAANPVDLQIGPGGDLFYVDFEGGTIRRIRYAPETTRTFRALADARVQEANPSTNYGNSATLKTDGGADPDVDTYLRYSVQGVSGAVTSAKLRVWATDATTNGPAAFLTGSGWSETAINWGNRPARTSGAHDDKGAIAAGSWVEYDVTPLVTGNGNYGFALATTSSDAVSFNSDEASDATRRPQLVVRFSGGGGGTATETLIADSDGRVEQASPTNNYGSSATLRADGGPDPDAESYLRFPGKTLPGTVEGAKLRVYVPSGANTGTANGPAAYRTAWTGLENALTWNNRPARTSGATDDKGPLPANAWVEYDVAAITAGGGPYSFVLATDNTDAVTFDSSETARKPELLLTVRAP